MAQLNFEGCCEMIRNYYGAESDIWAKISTGRVTNAEMFSALEGIPDVHITRLNDGTVAGINYAKAMPSASAADILGTIDSNAASAMYGEGSATMEINSTVITETGTGTKSLASGARTVSTGTRVATVASKVNTAITAVAAGMFLGAKIDSALYNVGKFFDLNPPEELNPETWDTIATTEAGKQVIRFLFGLEDDEATAYMSEDALEYMYRYWEEQGMWNTGAESVTGYPANFPNDKKTIFPLPVPVTQDSVIPFRFNNNQWYAKYQSNSQPVYAVWVRKTNESNYDLCFYSKASFKMGAQADPNFTPNNNATQVSYTVAGSTYRFYYRSVGLATSQITGASYVVNTTASFSTYELGYLILYGDITEEPALDGVTQDPNATDHITPSQIDTSQPILPQLKTLMPNTFTNPIQEDVLQPDGTTKTITYYPVPWPSITTDTEKPVTGTKYQDDPTVTSTDPTSETQPLVDVITYPLPQPSTPTPGGPATPPATGDGDTPATVIPDGSASSLWAIYNPTQAQLDAFGSWLWSSNFIEQIKKLFSDPMQAIIGVHKVFATPATGTAQTIKCGYIDSGVSAAVVTDQYTTIDCGSVDLREYFGNVFDYSPFTEVSLYLPFIGIVKLDVADVMRSTINVKYHVDVITGACLADVEVIRDAAGGVLYQYSGSAIVTYPVSSGSYASAVAGVLSIGAGIAATVATGGAAAPAVLGGALGLTKLHTDVQKSGSFSGAPGAMGCKIPYIIISRPQTQLPENFEWFEGKPANESVLLSDCSGFIRVKDVHLENIPALGEELSEIESLLKTGVII